MEDPKGWTHSVWTHESIAYLNSREPYSGWQGAATAPFSFQNATILKIVIKIVIKKVIKIVIKIVILIISHF